MRRLWAWKAFPINKFTTSDFILAVRRPNQTLSPKRCIMVKAKSQRKWKENSNPSVMKFSVNMKFPLTPRCVLIFSVKWSFQWSSQRIRPGFRATPFKVCFLSWQTHLEDLKKLLRNIVKLFPFRSGATSAPRLEQSLLWCLRGATLQKQNHICTTSAVAGERGASQQLKSSSLIPARPEEAKLDA